MSSSASDIKLSGKSLVMIPTYNERENAGPLCDGLLKLGIPFDILFVDDNSPDGTGVLLDELASAHANVHVFHRQKKEGIGSAHVAGIDWAYEHRYDLLLTMDCDFTHPPETVAEAFRGLMPDDDVFVGSRYLRPNSLPGWAATRRMLTVAGHAATNHLLGMPYDATGALRLYRISNIPQSIFHMVYSKGYSFFFESLYVLHKNKFRIREFPIELPARTYGHSKMTYREVFRSVKLLCSTFFIARFSPEKHQYVDPIPSGQIDSTLVDKQGWDYYWQEKKPIGGLLYDAVASIYRKFLIQNSLRHFIEQQFPKGGELLHAGCGSGQVDLGLKGVADITALDISVNALQFYRKTHGADAKICHGSIFKIPVPDNTFDGVYNLGVLEHFDENEIHQILGEFQRVLRPGGKAVIFWPPEYGLSVLFFKSLRWFYATFLGKADKKFHPDEITRLTSAEHAKRLIAESGLDFRDYFFGARDLFTYAVIVAEKPKEMTVSFPEHWEADAPIPKAVNGVH